MEELIEADPEACSVRVDLYGLRVGVRTNVPGALEALPRHLPIGWQALPGGALDRWYALHDRNAGAAGAPPLYVLEQGGRQLVQSEELSATWQSFEYELELYVVEHSPDYVFLHAGVVGWQGLAILIPGRSYSGKSTLVAALCQAGAEYYSDEYAVLDRQGQVHPYPRPLRLRQPLPDISVPDGLASAPAGGRVALPVGLVVVTQHEPGAVWQPQPVSPGLAILELLGHALASQQQPQVVLAVLRQALGQARTVRGPRGEAKETAQRLLQEVTRKAEEHRGKSDR
jgi:hypothetical protein